MSQRLNKKFESLKSQNKKAFVSYIMACDPDIETTADLLEEMPKNGVDIIELGMAFSDPAAEGPTIQAAAIRALEAKSDISKVLDIVRNFRKNNNDTPIILMGYYNPIYNYGCEKFVKDSLDAQVDGFIIVDLPPEEEHEITVYTDEKDISLIKLTTPTTDESRLEKILKSSGGFIYYVSVAGVTGQKEAVQTQVAEKVKFIKSNTDLPVCVGFGIKDEKTAKEISSVSDGVVIGSAFVNLIAENIGNRQKAVQSCSNFAKGIRKAID